MKVNVLRINDKSLNEDESTYDLDYDKLIKNNTLELAKWVGKLSTVIIREVKELFQDDFNFLRITTTSGDKYIIAPSKPIDLNKDLKTQQVKEVLKKLNEKHSVVIEIENGKYVIRLEENFLYEYPMEKYTSNDNESLEDFILRISETFVNNK